jgi:hypothetical protein
MARSRYNVTEWLRNNWLELLLMVILALAVIWIVRTATALMPGSAAEPVPLAETAEPIVETPLGPYEPTRVVTPTQRIFDGARAQGFVAALTALGPRPSGVAANLEAASLIAQELRDQGWEVVEQEVEQDGRSLRNVIARAGQGAATMIGAHYYTSPLSDLDPDTALRETPTIGANDGASGAAVLLELARSLDKEMLTGEVWLAFFDGKYLGSQEAGADPPASAGAAALAQSLDLQPEAMILVDMVGESDQQFFFDANSDPRLSNQLWQVAEALGFARWFIPEVRHEIANDHLPFRDLGVPVAALVDLDYPFWRTTQDTADKLSPDGLERVGRVLEVFLER